MLSPLVPGAPGSWARAVQWDAPDRHDPPRITGSRVAPVAGSARRSAHHSHTLPSVSRSPHAFAGSLPTGCRPRPFDSAFGLGVYVTLNHEYLACSMEPLNRRTFLFASSGAAAGSLLVPGLADAAEGDKAPHAGSGLVTGKPKALRHKEVPGFLSAAQLAPHHTAHYGGALKAFVGFEEKFEEHFAKGTAIDAAAFERLKQLQSSRGNSVILHELYFDGLALKAPDPPEGVRKAVE